MLLNESLSLNFDLGKDSSELGLNGGNIAHVELMVSIGVVVGQTEADFCSPRLHLLRTPTSSVHLPSLVDCIQESCDIDLLGDLISLLRSLL